MQQKDASIQHLDYKSTHWRKASKAERELVDKLCANLNHKFNLEELPTRKEYESLETSNAYLKICNNENIVVPPDDEHQELCLRSLQIALTPQGKLVGETIQEIKTWISIFSREISNWSEPEEEEEGSKRPTTIEEFRDYLGELEGRDAVWTGWIQWYLELPVGREWTDLVVGEEADG
ncbi:uncharacterized protein JCM15063_004693 [Sporobolomyces koalae]|uniref:uncharacterized protein n=1 Tax=Sporobolomyces koalae TaxID=500713 RepID=UPI00316F9777